MREACRQARAGCRGATRGGKRKGISGRLYQYHRHTLPLQATTSPKSLRMKYRFHFKMIIEQADPKKDI